MSTSADVLSSVANPQTQAQAGGSADVLKQVATESNSVDTPVKMVSPKGEVVYARGADNVANLQKQGHTRIEPDGSFYPQNIPGEDPLETEKRRERIFQALTPGEKHGANINALKDFAKTGAEAATDTALGVTGASGVGAALGVGGEAASPAALAATRVVGRAAGPVLRLASTPAGKYLLTKVAEAATGGAVAAGFELVRRWISK